jgi:hypothetical protein
VRCNKGPCSLIEKKVEGSERGRGLLYLFQFKSHSGLVTGGYCSQIKILGEEWLKVASRDPVKCLKVNYLKDGNPADSNLLLVSHASLCCERKNV